MRRSKPLSRMIRAMILYGRHHQVMTVGQCLKIMHGRGIALALFPFCLLNSLPVPGVPGFSTITGIPIVILGFQLTRGSRSLWVPGIIAKRRLNPKKWVSRLKRVLPYLKRVEKILQPRWLTLSAVPVQRAYGGVFIIMGIILALPLPFMNFPVGFALSLLVLGMITRDGWLIVIALLCNALLLAGMPLAVSGVTNAAQS